MDKKSFMLIYLVKTSENGSEKVVEFIIVSVIKMTCSSSG